MDITSAVAADPAQTEVPAKISPRAAGLRLRGSQKPHQGAGRHYFREGFSPQVILRNSQYCCGHRIQVNDASLQIQREQPLVHLLQNSFARRCNRVDCVEAEKSQCIGHRYHPYDKKHGFSWPDQTSVKLIQCISETANYLTHQHYCHRPTVHR